MARGVRDTLLLALLPGAQDMLGACRYPRGHKQ